MKNVKVVLTIAALGLGAFVMAQNSQSRLIEPNAGNWKTWVIPSGSSLRLAAPDRSQERAEIAELKAISRDAKALESVAYWNAGAPNYRWQQIALGQYDKIVTAPARFARTMSLMNVAIYDAMVAAWDSKYAFKRLRPSSRDTSLETLIPTPASPSYPSEQAVAAGAASSILSYIYPAETMRFKDRKSVV